VAYAWKRLNAEGPPSALDVLKLRIRTTTCVIDAFWERKETMKMTGLLNEIRFALRSLLRYPTFTLIAVTTLALGIGANTAVFTLVDGVLLSPLPFDEPDELIALNHLGREGRDQLPMSTGLYLLYREQASSLDEVGLYGPTTVTLVADGQPERIEAQAVTPSFFSVLRAEASAGRTFLEEEGVPEAERVALLSDGLWRSHFGGDPSMIGQLLDVNGTMRRVVGVMPPDFGYPDRNARLWVPLVVDPARAPLANFGAGGVARLAEENSVQSVTAELQGLITRLPELFPESGAPAFLQEVGLRARIRPLKEALVGDVTQTLWILLGTVGFVLLIACANVANLLLVRAEGRQREMALRVAIGAGRVQVLRSFASESLILASLGGALGTLIAGLAVRASVRLAPTDLPRMAEIGVDLRVIGFTAAVALGCAVFFGLFPLLRYGADNLAGQLREGSGRGATGGRERHRLRNGLVVLQMALALVLLIGSGLMFRSVQALRSVDPGFRVDDVLTARITVPTAEVQGWAETAGFFRELADRLQGQPGVESVGFAQSAPLAGGLGYFSIEVEDHPRGPDELPVFASNNFTEVGYLESMGIRLLEGRTFQNGDGAEGARSVVVTKSFADHWWPDQSAVGRRMRLGFEGEDWYQIVGVVADAHYDSLEDTPEEMVYWPATVGPADQPQATRAMDVTIRTATDPIQLVPVLRREVRALNPRIPVSNPRTMEDVFRSATARSSFTMALLGAASGVALLLGLVGIYGVISYIVSQRTREIGVRMALGASAPTVRGMVVRQGLTLAAWGVGIGLVAAAALSSVMGSILFGVSAKDPITYALVALALVAVALLASWIPATRAAGVNPSHALRVE
jgi:predicted permease